MRRAFEFAFTLATVMVVALASGSLALQCTTGQAERIDCGAFVDGLTEQECLSRGCCWSPVFEPSVPWCFYQSNAGYIASSVVDTPTGLAATLTLGSVPGPFGGDITPLLLTVDFETETRVHVKIVDPASARYQVPAVVQIPPPTTRAPVTAYTVSIVPGPPWGLIVTRVATSAVLLNTTLPGFVYTDTYLSMSTVLPPNAVLYGLGEHVDSWLVQTNYTTYTQFARDQGTPVGPQFNLYGSYPVYVQLEADGSAHGVYLLNSNGNDVVLAPGSLSWRTIGGVLEFYVFLGPTPTAVVQQASVVFGTTFLPPYWALGFHLCRWGYNSLAEVQAVNAAMRAAALPQSVQWTDIDYMAAYRDFTTGPLWPAADFAAFIAELHTFGQRFVPITDPGISNTAPPGSYPPYDDGLAANVFLLAADGVSLATGTVWPGETVFPDFFSPNASSYWTAQLAAFHELLGGSAGGGNDGLWIDMNEISSFGMPLNCQNEPQSPYLLGGQPNLAFQTLCLSTISTAGVNYNVHSLYGYSEAVVTMAALNSIRGERSFVLSRSTYANSGSHTAHWLGDNDSTWASLLESMAGVLDFQLFGVPMVGADVCGFNGNTTAELCTRWMQLGAFYPFYRNHNSKGEASQEPYVFGEPFTSYMQTALNLRYSLIPYLYTALAESHAVGTPVVNSLAFAFPAAAMSSEPALLAISEQYLFGPALLVSPVLFEGAVTVVAYIPQEQIWYDWYTGLAESAAGWVELDAPLSTIRVHAQGGSVVPTQEPALNTQLQAGLPYSLTAALDTNGTAVGSLYLDDGVTIGTYESGLYTLVELSASYSSAQCVGAIKAAPSVNGFSGAGLCTLGSVRVFGVDSFPESGGSVTVNGVAVGYSYSAVNATLSVSALAVPLSIPIVIAFSCVA